MTTMKHCPICSEEMIFSNGKVAAEMNGIAFHYSKQMATCIACDERFETPEILDINLSERNRAYAEAKSANGMAVKENVIRLIEGITIKYHVGKKPLAKLLGWSEATLMRYSNRDNPSLPLNDYLKTLAEIHDDPLKFAELYRQNKQNVSPPTQRKIERALKQLNTLGSNKIVLVANYFIHLLGDITPLALQKLLYYAQGFYMALHGRELFEDDCEAWVYGPVYPAIYRQFKDVPFQSNGGAASVDTVLEGLDSAEKTLLDAIIKAFGCYSGSTLANMTHRELPWKNARGELDANVPSNNVIAKSDITAYFDHVKQTFNITDAADIQKYAVNLFNEVY